MLLGCSQLPVPAPVVAFFPTAAAITAQAGAVGVGIAGVGLVGVGVVGVGIAIGGAGW